MFPLTVGTAKFAVGTWEQIAAQGTHATALPSGYDYFFVGTREQTRKVLARA